MLPSSMWDDPRDAEAWEFEQRERERVAGLAHVPLHETRARRRRERRLENVVMGVFIVVTLVWATVLTVGLLWAMGEVSF